MTELRTTHRTSVTEDMIDHLGHMNVRHYGAAARAATDEMVRELGAPEGVSVEPVDLYTRHHREQLLGARLAVGSTVVDAGDGWLRLYHELRNGDTGELAASFVHRVEPADGSPAPGWPPAVDGVGEVPEAGRPRSIALDTRPLEHAPSLDEVGDDPLLAMRRPRTIEAAECRADGTYDPAAGPMLFWHGEPIEGTTGPVLHRGPNGEAIGWATMENRMVIARLPRLGDRIQSFGCTVGVFAKGTHRLMWAYDLDRGDLLAAFEVVDVALDTISRRAVAVPDDLRAEAEARLRPALAGRG